MLEIDIPEIELYDDANNRFITYAPQSLQLEHSLVSLSKWESKWHKPFLTSEKTREENIDYVRCMTIKPKKLDEDYYLHLPSSIIKQINAYIEDPMTATTISPNSNGSSNNRQIITNELIYYWMIGYQIPVEFERWHLRRLMTLISVCDEKNKPPKKISEAEIMARNAEINARNRARFHSKG